MLDAEAQILQNTPFESVADRAKSLLGDHAGMIADPSEIRLLHSDSNPKNMFVDSEGEISCMIDWEYATAGDPARDLAQAEWTCLDDGPFHPTNRDALLEGYHAIREIPAGYERRRTFYRALFPVGTMVGLAGGSEAEQGEVDAPPERIRKLREQFERRIDAINDR